MKKRSSQSQSSYLIVLIAILASSALACSVDLGATQEEPVDLAATVDARVQIALDGSIDQEQGASDPLPTTVPAGSESDAPELIATADQQDASESQDQDASPTPEPSPMPEPSPTPDPNPPLVLPFSDNFDSGVAGAWRVVSGNPVVSAGKLGASKGKDVVLEIGNHDLQDYTVEFSLSGDDYGWGGYYSDLIMLLTPVLQVKLHSADMQSRVEWYAFENDAWELVTKTTYDYSKAARYKVTVTGNRFQVYSNEKIASELVYGPLRDSGAPFVLHIHGERIWLDDFVIH